MAFWGPSNTTLEYILLYGLKDRASFLSRDTIRILLSTVLWVHTPQLFVV